MNRRKTYIAAGAAILVVGAATAGALTWAFWPSGTKSRTTKPAVALGISVGEQSKAPPKASPSIAVASAVAALRGPISAAPAGVSLPSLSVAPLSRTSISKPAVELPTVQSRVPEKIAPNVAVAGAISALFAGGGTAAGTSAPVVSQQTAVPSGASANSLGSSLSTAQTPAPATAQPSGAVTRGGAPAPLER